MNDWDFPEQTMNDKNTSNISSKSNKKNHFVQPIYEVSKNLEIYLTKE